MKQHTKLTAFVLTCALSWAFGNTARAVLISSGNGNTDAASLLAAGGPGDPLLPGFVNVGKGSTGNSSVTYLGGGWVITAGHVTIDNDINLDPLHPTPIRFGSNTYMVDMNSIRFLHNLDNTLADLKIFRLTSDPGLPSLIPSLLNNVSPTGRLIMIGNGLSRGDQHFWNVDKSGATWQWNEGPAPSNPPGPGLDDYSGFDITYDLTGNRVIRWGENSVLNPAVFAQTAFDPDGHPLYTRGFTTAFDDQLYTHTTPWPSEAQGTVGDSGGPVFSLVGGQWKLSGIITSAFSPLNNSPDSTALFGDQTLVAEMRIVRDEILTIVPEPGGAILALAAAAGLALGCRRRKR
jgi:MYXO-CTERM domain-containing protein